MTTIAHKWASYRRLPSGHRLFFTGDPDRIAIADNSGRTPDQTDDGTLWLDFTRPLTVAGKQCFAPIETTERGKYNTPIDFETTLYLSERYDWPIKLDGLCFRAVRCEST